MDVVKVNARGAARLRSGHPWIFRVDVVSSAAAGADEVRVADERGRVLGTALWAAEPAPIALRVIARGDAPVRLDEAELGRRLAAAVARRRGDGGALPEACRLVHAEADRLPGLFVDKWGDAVVLQTACAAMDRREPAIAAWLARELGARLVVARDDGSTRDLEGLPRRKAVLAGGGPTVVQVREGQSTFEHDLLEDAKTGGFLDQQDNHVRAGELMPRGGEAVDLFSHHGGFALALATRAAKVTAVELDPRAAARAARNAQLSGRTNVEVVTADAFLWLREAERTGRRFDLVCVDPPALAKRGGGGPRAGGGGARGPSKDALRAYHELNLRAMRLVRPDGLLVTCSCSGKVTSEHFGEMLEEAARDAGRDAVILARHGAAADHPVLVGVPETEYLKTWFLRIL